MTTSHVRFWFAMIIATFFLAPGFRDAASMEAFAAEEVRLTRETFGGKVTNWLQTQASIVYRISPAENIDKAGIDTAGVRRTRAVVPQSGEAVVAAYNTYIKRLTLNAYVATLRLFVVVVWAAVLAPVFIAAVIDGLMQRAIKRIEFGVPRPAAYALTSLVVVPLLMGPIFYLVIPVSITPLVTPMWAMVTALPLALMVANMQPVFGKN